MAAGVASQVKVKQNIVNVDQHVTKYKRMVARLNSQVSELKAQLATAKAAAAPTGPSSEPARPESATFAKLNTQAVEVQRQTLLPLFDQRKQIVSEFVRAKVSGACQLKNVLT